MKKQIITCISILSFSTAILTSCGGGGGSKDEPAPAPAKAVLVSPAQNELCNQGTNVANNQSTVTLKWNSAANANSYEIDIKNLESGDVITKTTTATQQDVTLKLGTPYSWYVVSKSAISTTTANSDTWKFYNSGPGTTNYAPFPAEIIAPAINQSISAAAGKVALSWNGSDVDNDIVSYDLYLSTTTAPALLKAGLTATQYDAEVSSGTTYYWKVITKDSKGNTSDSGIYQFKVN